MTQPAFNAQNHQSPFKPLDVNQQPKFGGLQPFEGATLLLEDFPLADPCPPPIPGEWGSPSHPTNHPRLYRQKVSYNNPVKQKKTRLQENMQSSPKDQAVLLTCSRCCFGWLCMQPAYQAPSIKMLLLPPSRAPQHINCKSLAQQA